MLSGIKETKCGNNIIEKEKCFGILILYKTKEENWKNDKRWNPCGSTHTHTHTPYVY